MSDYDLWGNTGFTGEHFGEVHRGFVKTHGPDDCAGEFCPYHNPSDHPLCDAPMVLRMDRAIPLVERTCVHGVGHPDPDSMMYFLSSPEWLELRSREELEAEGIHGCDGCCVVRGGLGDD